MITLQLSGGLGNQMFQAAAAFALAKRTDAALCFDLTEFERYDLRKFLLNCFNLPESVQSFSKSHSLVDLIVNKIHCNNRYIEPHYHFDERFFQIKDGKTMQGYFQSERYFKEIESDIRQYFTLKNALSLQSQEIFKQIKKAKTSISLHVRCGDYLSDAKTQAVHGSVSRDYYQNAIALMQKIYGKSAVFFIFSDDLDYVEENFDFVAKTVIVSGNDDRPQEDMMLMAACDHNILANSSFSWWGAWLNDNSDKTVIAPRNWFAPQTLAHKSTKDLFPEGWITL